VRLFLVSQSERKVLEAQSILGPRGIDVVWKNLGIEEIQTHSLPRLVRQKTLDAFQKVRLPLLVEHTALYVRCLNGLPGGLTQSFWMGLGPERSRPERFLRLFGKQEEQRLFACTMVGYCDGRKIVQAKGCVRGRIAPEPKGAGGFGWDSIFLPDGYSQTYAEMGDEIKDEISMRRKALDALCAKLEPVWRIHQTI
jgi:XTP/dITP diphosphohydrolase